MAIRQAKKLSSKLLLTVALGLALVSSAHADLFKCTQADGKVHYQEVPCTTGVEKPLDDRDRRQREEYARAKKEQEEKQRAAEEERTRREQASLEMRARSERNQAKNDAQLSTDLSRPGDCFGLGWQMAEAYAANWRNAADVGLMASQVMEEGCGKPVDPSCRSKCRSGFAASAKQILKK